jgi:hypothetical protein
MGACSERLGMIASPALNLAFQEFLLDGCRFFEVTVLQEEIPQGSNRLKSEIVVRAEMATQIPNDSFQERTRLRLAGVPVRNGNLGHQVKGLRMIRSEPALIGAKGGEHARKLGSLNRYTGCGLHGPKPAIYQT